MTHTPGPWEITEDADHDIYIRSIDGYRYWIAEIISIDGVQNLANASMIAAAPTMFEALKAVEWMNEGSGGMRCAWCKSYYPDHKPDCQRQAAIASAEGAE